jgi:hypothetical protein
MDCSAIRSAEHFIQEVVRKLSPRELVRLQHRQYPIYFPDFLERMTKKYNGPLVFLLDEFDAMLEALLSDIDLLDKLRASSNTGHCRFVIAGFRRLLQAFYDQHSPLFNFAKPLRLKEFRRDEAASLIVEPMENMRIRFERRNEIIDTIYDETAGQPNLVQYYCSILIEQLDRSGKRTISPDNLFNIYDDEDFRSFVLNTFMDNTNDLEKAIVYAIILGTAEDTVFVHDQHFDLEQIDNALHAHQIEVFSADLEESCRNLELAGTFAKQGQHYHFVTPVFPRLLQQNHNVDFLFRKLLQEGVW